LTWNEALIKWGAQFSAVLTIIDNPEPARQLLGSLPLPLTARASGAAQPAPAPSATSVEPPSQADLQRRRQEYEAARIRDIATPLAAMAAFSSEQGTRLVVVTPYGPYFQATDEQL